MSRFAPLWLALFAAAVRGVVGLRTSVIFEDGPHFLAIARAFSEGRYSDGLAHPYHPLYSALVAATQPVFGNFEHAALAVSALGGAIAVAASFVFLRDAFDVHVAWIGAALFAISPYPVRFTADVASEGVYLACFAAALALLWRGVQSEAPRSGFALLFAAGACSGLAYLARPEGAGLLVVGVLWLGFEWLRGGRSISETLRVSVSLVAGGLVFCLPYAVWVSRQRDGIALSGKKSLARTLGLPVEGIFDELSFATLAGASIGVVVLVAGVGALLRARPVGNAAAAATRALPWLGGCAFVAALVLAPGVAAEFSGVVWSTVRPEVFVVAMVGVVAAYREGWKARDGFAAFVLLAYVVVLVGLLVNYGYLSRRHFVPLMPIVLGYAGMGVVAIASVLAKRWTTATDPHSPAMQARVAFVIAAVLLAVAAPKTLHDHRRDVLAQRLAAEWLKEQELRSGCVASNKRRTGYYAARKWQPLTNGASLRGFEDLAGEKVRYIVADDRVLGGRDGLPPTPGFALRELHRIEAGGRVAMVYEFGRSKAAANADVSAGPPDDPVR
ncbi:MAG: glycosyltransferase family 39 protein [Myxococcota bacterium]|nr:glycosyltransferase family 39 protein [Myxococcota bacterium]